MPDHRRRTCTRPTSGPALACILLVAIAGACGTARGHLGELRRSNEWEGFKMLRPNAVAEACATTFRWEAGPDLAAEALRRLLQLDDEAAAVLDADVTWTWRSFGVLERRCISIRGDVVRPAPTIFLPMHHAHAASAERD